MKRSSLFSFALLVLVGVLIQNVNAGSAVAMERQHGNLATAYGGPVEREKQRALDEARRRYGADVRIIAATDVTGYGTIVVARLGNRAIIGVALGKRSAAEAATLAVEHCLKAGGTDPLVRWAWRG
jgi:selenophosphate synthase